MFRIGSVIVERRLPYYMAYPVPLLYDDDKLEKRDFEYMKRMYPDIAKTVLPYVEEECERMEYEGSMIYDEYPDQIQILMMRNRIYNKVKELDQEDGESEKDGWMKELIQVILFHELHQRRRTRRKYRGKLY